MNFFKTFLLQRSFNQVTLKMTYTSGKSTLIIYVRLIVIDIATNIRLRFVHNMSLEI